MTRLWVACFFNKLVLSLWEQYSTTSCGSLNTPPRYVITAVVWNNLKFLQISQKKNKIYANLVLNTSEKVLELLIITFQLFFCSSDILFSPHK